ncbi:MAG: DNA recombination protein RmuC, partial [Chlamydiae bacterium]|nr:DNA recombination protein RmuC [Chlamydiota bacterium]
LYERLTTMNNHFAKLGKSLSASVESYNQAISSLESRVLVSARRLKELGISSNEEDNVLEEVNKTTRSIYLEKEVL